MVQGEVVSASRQILVVARKVGKVMDTKVFFIVLFHFTTILLNYRVRKCLAPGHRYHSLVKASRVSA